MSSETPKYRNTLRYAGLATQMMALLLIAVWGGMKLDEALNSKPAFLIIFPVLGLGLSLWQLVRAFNKPKP